MERSKGNGLLFWPVIAGVVLVDFITKRMAVAALVPQRLPHELFGDAVRLTLVYNPGAAFGLHLGQYSRWIFMILTVAALGILWRLYQATRQGDVPRTLALALVSAGAIGNLIDRVRSSRGVVDFLDFGVGDVRWPVFNVADIAVTCGALMLAFSLWREEQKLEQELDGSEPE